MQKAYSIKATYKDKTYVIKGQFPTEDSIKKEILNRKIKDLTELSQFYIEYSEGASSLQQVYQECEKLDKNSFKINICKIKRNKKKQSIRKSVQTSGELILESSVIGLPTSQNNQVEEEVFKKGGFLSIQGSQEQSFSDLKATAQFQSHNQPQSIKVMKKKQQFTTQLPNLDISQILEHPPLESEHKFSVRNKNQKTQPKMNLGENILSSSMTQANQISSEKMSQKCYVCSSNNIESRNVCQKCQKAEIEKKLERFSKQLESNIVTKITEKLQASFNKKLKETESQMNKEISVLRSQSLQQANQIKNLLNNNQHLKQLIKKSQNSLHTLDESVTNMQKDVKLFSDKVKSFQKDFQLINQINFTLQNNYITLENKVEALSQNFRTGKSNSLNSIQADDKKQSLEASNSIKNPSSPPIKVDNHQPKNQDIQPQEKKVENSLPREQLRQLFANPKFEEPEKNENQISRKNLKPLDASIQQCEKVAVFKVGDEYQPKLKIKNTGSQKWPSQVFIFQKDSKRAHKIESLNPNKEYIFTDNFIQKGERQGQNIHIKYQVCFEQQGQKMYIGLPLSIFLKVKKAQFGKQESSEEESGNEDQNKKMGQEKIDEHKLNRSKNEVQGYGKKVLKEVEQEIKKSQQFIKMINLKKKELNQGYKMTKDIKMHLEQMGINELNFESCDQDMIEEIIRNVQVIDIMKRK